MSTEKLSVEDALRLENNNLKKNILQLQQQLVAKDEQLLHASIREKHKLQAGDEIDPQTLEIVRAPKAEEKAAKPKLAKVNGSPRAADV